MRGAAAAARAPRLTPLPAAQLLYRRVKLWCRRNGAAPLLTLEKDGFAGRSIGSVSKVSHYFQLVFLLCWAPGTWERGCPAAPAPAPAPAPLFLG